MVMLCCNRRSSNESAISRSKCAMKTDEVVLDVEISDFIFDEQNESRGKFKALLRRKVLTVDDFVVEKTVGTGTFGRVCIARLKEDAGIGPLALKILKKTEILRLKQLEHVKSEKTIMLQMNHPFIAYMHHCFQDKAKIYMVLEYISGGELFTLLRTRFTLPDDHVRYYAAEITLALAYLHERKIVYRDLKPENLLINRSGHMKIVDFGFAKKIDDRTWTLCGTPEYTAPEIITHKGHSFSVDWWSLGILIFEMLVGLPPFYDDNPLGIYAKILKGCIEFPDNFNLVSKTFIRQLLTEDRLRRLGSLQRGVEDIVQHTWNKDVLWEEMLKCNVSAPYIPVLRSMDDTSAFDPYPESEEKAESTTTYAQEYHERLFYAFEAS